MPVSPLLRRTQLLPGESLPSLLVRLAEANSYPSSRFLDNFVQALLPDCDSLVCPAQPETLTTLATLTGLHTAQLCGATVHRWADTLVGPGCRTFDVMSLPEQGEAVTLLKPGWQEHFWWEGEAQFCPHCLASQAYHRSNWMLRSVSVCLEHGCLLVRDCPDCGARMTVSEVVAGQCSHCGFDLTACSTTNVAHDAWGLLSQQFIQSWFGITTSPDATTGIPDQPASVLYQLFHFFQQAICTIDSRWDYLHDPFDADAGRQTIPCRARQQLTPIKSYLLQATAMTALKDWPHGFHQFLDAFRLRDQRQQTDTAVEDMGYLYGIRSDDRFQHPAFQFLLQQFEQYLHEHYHYSFALHKLRRLQPMGVLPIPLEYISTAEAARMLDLNPELVGRLVELGRLDTYQPRNDQARPHANLVQRQSVLDVQHRWRGAMPYADAAHLLGVTEKALADLVDAGLVQTRSANVRSGISDGVVNRSLADLVDRLRQGPVRYLYRTDTETVPLHILVHQGLGIAHTIERVLAAEIRAFWPPDSPTLAHLLLAVDDL